MSELHKIRKAVALTILSAIFAGCGKPATDAVVASADEGRAIETTVATTTVPTAPALAVAKRRLTRGPVLKDVEISATVSLFDAWDHAERMDEEALRAVALEYRATVFALIVQVDKLKGELATLSSDQALGSRAAKIEHELSLVSRKARALKARFDIYYNTLEARGSDVSGLEISNWDISG